MADRTAWRICRDNRWWSVFGKKRGRTKKAGPPVHDDLVRRDFTADGPNRLWLTDITEHRHSGREVVSLRDQGRLQQEDRGLLDRRADEVPPGRRRPGQRCCPA